MIYAAAVIALMVFCPTGLMGVGQRLRDRFRPKHPVRADIKVELRDERSRALGARHFQDVRSDPRGGRRELRRSRRRDPRTDRSKRLGKSTSFTASSAS